MRKTAAGKYVNASPSTGAYPRNPQILDCSAAATRNLELAHRMSETSHAPRWLHSGLHYIFNAAIISMLDTILSGPLNNEHVEHLNFVKEVFRQAAYSMDGYTDDCLRVLCDLEALAQRIQSQSACQSQTDSAGVTQQVPVVEPRSVDCSPGLPCPQPSSGWPAQGSLNSADVPNLNLDDSLIDELINWLEVDDMKMYGT